MKTALANYRAQLATLEAFAKKHGDKLPDELAQPILSGYENELHLNIRTGYSEQDRNKVLVLVADLFGRNGWTKRRDFSGQAFNWVREIDGVVVVIERAEAIPVMQEGQPVPPQSFPIQLVDAVKAA